MTRSTRFFSARTLSLLTIGLASSTALANVVGSDAQNFNPITSGLDFVTVQSSETLERGVLNLGFFANYAKNAFPYYESVSGSNRRSEKDSALVGGDFNLGLGLAKNWDAGLSFPVILSQQVSDNASVGRYSATGSTEIRVNTKYRLFGNQSRGVALVASANFNRISGNPYVGQGGGPIYNIELAADTTISQVAMALNIGYRLRNPGTAVPNTGIEPIPNQMIGSLAFSYFVASLDTKLIAEVLAAVPESSKLKNATDREYSVMEALLGLKHETSSSFSLHLGGGAGLQKGVSSPDFRVYAGINYSFGPLFGKKTPVQTDPYFENDQPVRFQKKKAPQALAVTPLPPPPLAAAPAPVKPVDSKRRRGKTAIEAPAPAPAPSKPLVNPFEEAEEVKPSVAVETVRDVKVFDRGSHNHIVLNSIEFMAGSNDLKPESMRYLIQELIPALHDLVKRRPISAIVVEGHTDSIGKEEDNLALSLERARIVAALLRAKLGLNIPLQPVGLGSSSPIADNGNFQGRSLNRRVEFKLRYQRTTR